MSTLASQTCIACRADSPRATDAETADYMRQLPEWSVVNEGDMNRLKRVFPFSNFVDALSFTNRVGELAESQGHHPLLITEWGRVTVEWWTHSIGGLHVNDFVMAARTDELMRT
jgi:4a-hydroxytetrahydrobiopterin dehydratase